MATPTHPVRASPSGIRRPVAEAVIGYSTFCLLGLLSRLVPAAFLPFVAYGIAFPLAYAGLTRDWTTLGFSRRGLSSALTWGIGSGAIWAAYTFVFFRGGTDPAPLLGLQVAIALPLWLLIMSPFQEFFFRGWLQPRMQAVVGKWSGLVLTALAFTLWHFFPQLEGTSTTTLPLGSALGVVSIFVAGLLFGYGFQRTGNILAPWVAHAIGGVALVLAGEMSFIQYSP